MSGIIEYVGKKVIGILSMEMNDLQLWVMLLLNSLFCLLVPRLLTTQWLTLLFTRDKSSVTVTQET
ncbi:hypothetical protein [Crocosphaera sp.]|uniref:hypothetical protein n=1 Tax=Crocosphaera sp. TaxID=2729996 RepID=UPI003F210A3D|nr:hypothetical protein [Crocosphaera sp.]